MKVTIIAAAVGLASASQILPRAPAAPDNLCCFTLTASAGDLGSAIIEEDTIGQNRVFSSYPDGYYCINPDEPGKLYDNGGRTCIISKTSQQFQCTLGLSTEVDFTVSDDGDFQADGSDKFWACLAGGNGNTADGSYLIYSDKKENPYGCVPIELSTTGNKCAGHGEGPVVGGPYGNTTTVTATPTPEPPLPPFTSYPVYATGGFSTVTTTVPASGYVPVDNYVPEATPTPAETPVKYPFDIFSPPASSASGYVPVDNYVPEATPTPVETPAGYPFDTSILPLPTSSTSSSASAVASLSPPLASVCPTTLIPGKYAAPALIVPVSPETPDVRFGTQYVAQITPGNNTLFSFDIPTDWEGSDCNVIFTFPKQENTAFPGAWKFAGRDCKIALSSLVSPIDQFTTYANTPAVRMAFGETSVVPGNDYVVSKQKCPAGKRIAIKAEAVGETAIEYFQATGPSAIGVWITRC